MYAIFRTNQFKRDVKRAQKRGKNIEHLKGVIRNLAQEIALPTEYRNHQLKGTLKDCRECHLEPDWLLVYRIQGNELHLVRTGSHSDLFR